MWLALCVSPRLVYLRLLFYSQIALWRWNSAMTYPLDCLPLTTGRRLAARFLVSVSDD